MSSRVGRYEVLARLAKGGMAELSLASTQGPGGFRKFVVLKHILAEAAGDENFVKMFLDEARVTAAFSHPSICQVFEMGEDPSTGLYVAMEFIAGQDLNQVVTACAKQQAVLPVGYSASVVHDCAQALHYAHTFKLPSGEDSPVIHRDVAQKNIMVTYDGQVKLLDFGIAKAKGALARTRAGTVKGTAGYMSPEQVRGDPIDGRSDVFSLGVVLWEMMTGRRLFSAETELAELKMILSEPIVAPTEVESSVPKELSAVAMKALERDLNLRYRSARDMARALSSSCGHLLFDAEERAEFMKERFEEKIASTQRLFEAAKKDEREVGAAVEEFRRSSAHDRELEEAVRRKPSPAISAGKLKQVRGWAPGAEARPEGKSLSKLKKVKVSSRKLEAASEPTPASLPKEKDYASTDAVVALTPTPRSASMAWPVLAVVVALGVGLLVWKAMQGPVESSRPHVVEPVVLTKIPGVELPGTDTPPLDPIPQPKEPTPKDPPVKGDTPRGPREKGEVTLVLIPEATVMKGSQVLGQGTMVSFSLNVGTHLVTVTGQDGVKRHLSLQVGAGKNKAQKYRLDDLPPQ
ncbi:MAG: serine/threonine-protein kinase [Archangium sp.]|nr:serine/threonine-protein kinase [Archangium sp.]